MSISKKNVILISILASIWAVQAAVVLQQFLGMWYPPMLLQDSLIAQTQRHMAPKWDLAIYIVFIAVALISGRTMFAFYKKPVKYWLLLFEGAVAFLMVSALFKIVIYDNSPQLAQRSLTALCFLAVCSKIFYPEFIKCIGFIYRSAGQVNWTPYADAWWVAVIFVLIYMPDLERVIALMYIGDWVHHFDYMVMSVGWASLWGQLPYADVISQYGVGLPVIFARIIKLFGAFDYVPALAVMMWFVIIYFIFMYFLVRYWLKSALIAGVAFLLVFRLQMFHYGVSPLIWVTPSASPIRFGFDILWMAALLAYIRNGRSVWLVFAAVYSGFSLYYMSSAGMCMMAAFYFYLFAFLCPPLRGHITGASKRLVYYMCWVLPGLSAVLFFGFTLKGHIFEKEYWHNFIDYMVVFGHSGAMPMWESLKYRHFWAFFMSMVMPLTYIATFMYTCVCIYLRNGPREWLFTSVLCLYGLANYQYYVVRSAITSYYVNALPFVLIVAFWFVHYLGSLPLVWQKRLKALAVILSFYALLTNQNYLAYPNLLSFSRNPMTDNLVIQRFPDRGGFFNNQYKKVREQDKLPVNDLGKTQEDLRTEDDFKNDQELVDYYRRGFDFREDAALIDRLTKPTDRVALLSSFETKILIQAGRAPYFYHFPMISSRPMTFRSYPNEAAQTPAYLDDTFKAFQLRPPQYVFMEKVYLQNTLPFSYFDDNNKRLERAIVVISYVKSHYQVFQQGQYLVAMKRKG